MYLTGNIADFEHRLHSLPTGANDIAAFESEGRVYLTGLSSGLVSPQESGKWTKERNLKNYQRTNDTLTLVSGQF